MRVLALFALFSLCACGAKEAVEIVVSGNTMGTQFNVKLTAADIDVTLLQQEIETSLAQVEHMMSTYMVDSEISRFNASTKTSWHEVSHEFCFSIEEALVLSTLTDGSFDITVGPLVNLWGFGPGDMYLPASVFISYDLVPYFEDYVDSDFDLEYVIVAANNYGPNKVAIYGFVHPKDPSRYPEYGLPDEEDEE